MRTLSDDGIDGEEIMRVGMDLMRTSGMKVYDGVYGGNTAGWMGEELGE
jgi:hypothetical protein